MLSRTQDPLSTSSTFLFAASRLTELGTISRQRFVRFGWKYSIVEREVLVFNKVSDFFEYGSGAVYDVTSP